MQLKKKLHRSFALRPIGAALALSGVLLGVSTPARADWLESLFGKSSSATRDAAKPGKTQRLWRLHEFTAVAIQPRETGSSPNQHPVSLQPEALRQQLAAVTTTVNGAQQPLFATDELNELVGPLTQALANAGPNEDVVLVSSSRREGGILAAPTAVTARLFVQGGALQFVVHDARFEFYDTYRGTHVEPTFTYGSRTAGGKPGNAALKSASAASTRADWLAIPLAMPTAAAAVPAAPGGAAPAAVAPAVPVVTAPAAAAAGTAAPAAVLPAPMPAPAAAPAPRKPMDAAGAEDIERRLETLKRLRDRNLITEEEYQQKRKEILQLL